MQPAAVFEFRAIRLSAGMAFQLVAKYLNRWDIVISMDNRFSLYEG